MGDHGSPGDGDGRASGGADVAATRNRLVELSLRRWQAEALAAWSETGRGVIEAVTGTGKTRLALAALRMVVDRGGRALVLVPTLDLLGQWTRELRSALPESRIGRLGGGGDDDLFANEVLVATPHSAASVPIDLPEGTPGLIVADEAHRYGAPTWAGALTDAFPFRLALTATYERGDDGLVEVLDPYFGGVVYRYTFEQAAQEGTIAPFAVARVGVRLTGAEQDAYRAADTRCRRLHRELVGGLGMPAEPRALFAAVSAVVAESGSAERDGPQARACREYLARVRERRDVAARAQRKLAVCAVLAGALKGQRTLVFTDTVDQAEAAARRIAAAGVAAETVHGGLERERRAIRLAQFRNGNLEVVVAPRVLDEGVDVPDADTAVVLAAFRNRRQLVQRLGRVLRVKPDGREARLMLLHAAETHEAPERDGHAEFLEEIEATAREVVTFEPGTPGRALVAWLRRAG